MVHVTYSSVATLDKSCSTILSVLTTGDCSGAALLRTLYPVYVLCGAAVVTGAVLGGLIVGFIKFILVVQQVRRDRADLAEHEEWRRERQYTPAVRDRYRY